ncbi:UTRA domain-containing protein [Yinghuangia aomiensis]
MHRHRHPRRRSTPSRRIRALHPRRRHHRRDPQKLTSGPGRLALLRATGSGFKTGEHVEILDAGLTAAPKDVADALGLEEGAEAIRRRRIYRDDLGVVTLSTSWLPGALAEAAPELAIPEPMPLMTFGMVEQRTGRRAVRRRDVIAVRPVLEDVASLMGVTPGAPMLTMVNLYWDQHGDATEYAVDILADGRELSADYALE